MRRPAPNAASGTSADPSSAPPAAPSSPGTTRRPRHQPQPHRRPPGRYRVGPSPAARSPRAAAGSATTQPAAPVAPPPPAGHVGPAAGATGGAAGVDGGRGRRGRPRGTLPRRRRRRSPSPPPRPAVPHVRRPQRRRAALLPQVRASVRRPHAHRLRTRGRRDPRTNPLVAQVVSADPGHHAGPPGSRTGKACRGSTAHAATCGAVLGIGVLVGSLALLGRDPIGWVSARWQDLRGDVVQVQGVDGGDRADRRREPGVSGGQPRRQPLRHGMGHRVHRREPRGGRRGDMRRPGGPVAAGRSGVGRAHLPGTRDPAVDLGGRPGSPRATSGGSGSGGRRRCSWASPTAPASASPSPTRRPCRSRSSSRSRRPRSGSVSSTRTRPCRINPSTWRRSPRSGCSPAPERCSHRAVECTAVCQIRPAAARSAIQRFIRGVAVAKNRREIRRIRGALCQLRDSAARAGTARAASPAPGRTA